MPISLNGNGTITGVTVGGLPDGIVDTDMIAANAVKLAKLGATSGVNGPILQIKQSVKTDTASSTADSFTNIGPTVAITPSSNTNRILVRFSFVGRGSSVSYGHYFRLARGGSVITGSVGDSSSSRTQAATGIFVDIDYSLGYDRIYFEFLDSPATTLETTYSIQHRRSSTSAGTFYMGRNYYDGTSSSYARFPSMITAMEVAHNA